MNAEQIKRIVDLALDTKNVVLTIATYGDYMTVSMVNNDGKELEWFCSHSLNDLDGVEKKLQEKRKCQEIGV